MCVCVLFLSTKTEDGSRVRYISENNMTESSNSVQLSCAVCIEYIAPLNSFSCSHAYAHGFSFFILHNVHSSSTTYTHSFFNVCVRVMRVYLCPCLCPFIHTSCHRCCRAAYGGTHKKRRTIKAAALYFGQTITR